MGDIEQEKEMTAQVWTFILLSLFLGTLYYAYKEREK